MTAAERRGLRKLMRAKDQLRYTVGDKCGGFVVIPKLMDKELTKMALADTTVYEETTKRTFDTLAQQLRTTTRSILTSKVGVKAVGRLLVNSPVVPTYYSLIKTHKIGSDVDMNTISVNDIKTRPIISCCGGSSDRISWLLVKLLSPLLKYVGAHKVNVEQFIGAVERCQMPNSVSYVSFDAVSLYTNVDNECATRAMLDLLQEHQADVNVLGLARSELEQLLLATLACNVFRFDNKFYMQRRGLAMGLRLAPLLAIVYLDRIERMSLTSELIFYRRYIDDVFAIGSTPVALQHFLNNLNSQDPNIQFTVEEPDANSFLPFLNAKVRIRNGLKEFSWYRKPSSKNIIIHSRSAHPIYMKANVVRNIGQTKDRICGVAHDLCDEDMETILEENG
ncbi:hypothetical protein Y032_0009g502 [Ancylostoma ceylanicum]|uniref:Reverse transcriptase domain-containing protein n=1 Tax=Ancylostoma ceylanicum TaxID=53326 RepID=A0A016VJ90_9BILA|nr:hypothetical protein Y032_0009g502 [Ancylostoma ceylanicum]